MLYERYDFNDWMHEEGVIEGHTFGCDCCSSRQVVEDKQEFIESLEHTISYYQRQLDVHVKMLEMAHLLTWQSLLSIAENGIEKLWISPACPSCGKTIDKIANYDDGLIIMHGNTYCDCNISVDDLMIWMDGQRV